MFGYSPARTADYVVYLIFAAIYFSKTIYLANLLPIPYCCVHFFQLAILLIYYFWASNCCAQGSNYLIFDLVCR